MVLDTKPSLLNKLLSNHPWDMPDMGFAHLRVLISFIGAVGGCLVRFKFRPRKFPRSLWCNIVVSTIKNTYLDHSH